MKSIFNFFVCTMLLYPLGVQAQWWESSFDLDVGYRSDNLSNLIDAYSSPNQFSYSSDLKLDNLRIWEIGTKGKCIACEHLLLKGFVYIGEIVQGKYDDTLHFANQAKQDININVKSGKTVDFSVGAGYLFPVFCGVRIGPTAGWSYDQQNVNMTCNMSGVKGLKFKNRWQGAWIGADAYLSFFCFGLNAGYEYHIPHWSGYRLVNKTKLNINYYSDVRKASRGYGNVVYIDAYTTSFCLVKLNCQLKYQYWKMHDGCEHPKSRTFKDVGLEKKSLHIVKQATWESFEILFGLGLDF